MSTQSRETPEQARVRLGELLDKRRRELGVSAVRVFPSLETWRRVARGDVAASKTYRRVETELGLATFACDDVLGGAPELRLADSGEVRDEDAAIVRRVYEEAGEIMEGLAVATPEERQELTEWLAKVRARRLGQNHPN